MDLFGIKKTLKLKSEKRKEKRELERKAREKKERNLKIMRWIRYISLFLSVAIIAFLIDDTGKELDYNLYKEIIDKNIKYILIPIYIYLGFLFIFEGARAIIESIMFIGILMIGGVFFLTVGIFFAAAIDIGSGIGQDIVDEVLF